MLKVVLCLVIALSLTNALPVRNRFSEDFDDYAREAAARRRSHFEDLYDSYLRRREPSKSEWVTHISHEPRFERLFLRITYDAVIWFASTGRLEDYLLPQPKQVYDDSDIPGMYKVYFYLIFWPP